MEIVLGMLRASTEVLATSSTVFPVIQIRFASKKNGCVAGRQAHPCSNARVPYPNNARATVWIAY